MAWRVCVAVVATCWGSIGFAADAPLRYLPFDAPVGASQAVVVQGVPLVHTRQLLPVDREGKLVGEGSAEKQIEQVLANLESVLREAGSGLDKLVRVNVCAIEHGTVDRVRAQLRKRLGDEVRPAVTAVLTPLPHRKALVAIDAVAAGGAPGEAVALKRCENVAGDKDRADFAVLPPGGVAYLSGQPEKGELTISAVTKSLTTLLGLLEQLKASPAHVVQLKVFLRPATSADEVAREIKKLFPDQLAPPMVFVEWIASVPVEIELIAYLPPTDKQAPGVEYYTPRDAKFSPAFSRAALVRCDRQIYVSGLSARKAGDGEVQARDVFAQLKEILAAAGSDLNHVAKATYYVSDDNAGDLLNKVRPEFLDQQNPPAASKVTVHGVGQAGRTLTIDVIAVSADKQGK